MSFNKVEPLNAYTIQATITDEGQTVSVEWPDEGQSVVLSANEARCLRDWLNAALKTSEEATHE